MANNHTVLGTFPFGNPVLKVQQIDRTAKPIFILGVYGSSVVAQFNATNAEKIIRYLPVDNEPELFWCGEKETIKKVNSSIEIPRLTGKLTAETSDINGVIGRSLDKYYLHPLKLHRNQVWICNLIPHLVTNKIERKSIKRYNEIHSLYNLPKAEVPTKKESRNFISKKRLLEIIEELFQSRAEVIITLGQQPIKWFLQEFDKSIGNLLNVKEYGLITEVQIESVKFKLIPLFHPRQLLKEKNIDTRVGLLHYDWIKTKAKKIKIH